MSSIVGIITGHKRDDDSKPGITKRKGKYKQTRERRVRDRMNTKHETGHIINTGPTPVISIMPKHTKRKNKNEEKRHQSKANRQRLLFRN